MADLSDDELQKLHESEGLKEEPTSSELEISQTASLEKLNKLAAIATPKAAYEEMPGVLANVLDDLKDDFEKIKELGEEAKDLVEAGNDILDGLKKAKEKFEEKNGGGATTSEPQGGTGTDLTTGEDEDDDDDSASDGNPPTLFGEEIFNEDELLYSIWIDRVMAFEVDGAGDDEVYWTAETKVYLTNPNAVITNTVVSDVYSMDEREELRTLPPFPESDRRALPLSEDDWEVIDSIDSKDARLALQVDGANGGIALSRLAKVELKFYLYETDHMEELISAVAALGAAATAVLGIVSGGTLNITDGSMEELTDGIEEALKRLNKLVSKDRKLIRDERTFLPQHFETAFLTGQVIPVSNGTEEAALGLPIQRMAGAETEEGKNLYHVDLVDRSLSKHQSELKDPEFYEDEYDSYYEVRLRFQRPATAA